MGLKVLKICACTSYHNEYNIVRTKLLKQNTFLQELHLLGLITLKSLKMVNAQRVFLKENSHFLQDRPHLKNG